jgi:hypothetical protein
MRTGTGTGTGGTTTGTGITGGDAGMGGAAGGGTAGSGAATGGFNGLGAATGAGRLIFGSGADACAGAGACSVGTISCWFGVGCKATVPVERMPIANAISSANTALMAATASPLPTSKAGRRCG